MAKPTTQVDNTAEAKRLAAIKAAKAAKQAELEAEAEAEAAAAEAEQAHANGAGAGDGDEADDSADDEMDKVINLDNVVAAERGAREIVPRGNYLCTITETTFQTFKSGSKGVKIKLEVADGEFAAGGKRKRGLSFYFYLVHNTERMDQIKATLIALQFPKDRFSTYSLRTLQEVADEADLVGTNVVAYIKIGSYQGDKTNEVGGIAHESTYKKKAGMGAGRSRDMLDDDSE